MLSTIFKHRYFLLFLLIATIGSACQKVFEKPRWNTDIVAPLVKTSLGIGNIMKDTSLIKVDGDTVKIVIRQKLYDFNFDSLIKLEAKPFKKKVMLSTLKLADQQISRSVSLGELAKAMVANGDNTGQLIMDANGFNMIVTDIDNLTAGPMPVDVNQFFESAKMKDPGGGNMNIKIENGLPLNIRRLEFDLKNKSEPIPAIAHEIFTNLNSGTTQDRDVDLSGKTMEGNLEVDVLDMDIEGGFVKIDTSDAITITLTISDVSVTEATAIFPAQNVVDERYEEPLQGMKDARLRLAIIDEGEVVAESFSTSQDVIYFTYTIPSATIGADTFEMKTTIPKALPGQTVHSNFDASFDKYNLDLRGNPGPPSHDIYNTFYNVLVARIEYTGQKVHLSLKDSIDIEVKLKSVKPYYVEGYLGRDTINISGSTDFDVFKNVESGVLNFEKVKVSLEIENGFGVKGEFDLNSLSSTNTRTGQVQPLTVLPLTTTINKATKTPFTPYKTEISLDGSAVNLLNNLPDKINYNAQIRVNDAFASVYEDFAYSSSNINPYLNVELPLSINANQLVLSDTADFISENFQTSVKSGSFTVHIENGFPIGGDLKLYFLDQGGAVIDSVISSGSIVSGVLVGDRVVEKKSSRISFYLDENRMQNVLRARKMVFKVKFSTPAPVPPATHVRFFSDYMIDFKLVGDFSYTIE